MQRKLGPWPLNFDTPRKGTHIERLEDGTDDHSVAWHHLLQVLPQRSVILDEGGVIRYASSAVEDLMGHVERGLVGQSVEVLAAPGIPGGPSEIRRPLSAVEGSTSGELTERWTLDVRVDGPRAFDVSMFALVLEGRSWVVLALESTSDETSSERHDTSNELSAAGALAAAVALAEGEERFHLAFDENPTAMTLTDVEERIIDANAAFCQLIGRERDQILGRDATSFTHLEDQGVTEGGIGRTTSGDGDSTRVVTRFVHTNGQVMFVELTKSRSRDAAGSTLYFVDSVRDITEERELSAQLSHQALHDPLTGLANRALFEDRYSQAHARVNRHGGLGAVFLVDLDGFKGVNDTHGHLIGDQLLTQVARRLEQVTRSSDTLCRFGGDEFLYLAEGLTSAAQADQVAARLLNALSSPFSIAGLNLEQHASLGVGVWDSTSSDSSEVVRDADAAMYEAKRRGKGGYVVFAAGMQGEGISRFSLAQELRRAFDGGEIVMHYQPIVDLASNRAVGFEALMRWHHPVRGWVHPSVFIPLAEQSPLIYELGSFALRESVAAASGWVSPDDRLGAPYVSVNVSSSQFHDPNFMTIVEETLQSTSLAPERLVIEITESIALLDIPATLTVMEHLSRLGIGIALDDFGTGFASLSYLVLLHPRILKIDQSFVSPASETSKNDALTEAIVALGHKLGITMLAEGIETHAQLERFRGLGCELGQGFLFSPAVAASEVPSIARYVLGEQA